MPEETVLLSAYTGFHGGALALLVAAGVAGLAWAGLLAWRWFATFPYLPDADPPTDRLGDEPPALVNFLVHRWHVTRPALAATLLDLAARGLVAIEQYGEQVVVRVYEERASGAALNRFDRQVLDHVSARVRGRSAPLQALELGEEAEAFWKRFRRNVEDEARAAGLARWRWTNRDRVLLGGALAVALGLLALAFGAAHLGQDGSEEDIGTVEWLIAAGVAWFGVNTYVFTRRALRETPSGSAACRRWLGVRRYLEDAGTFGDLPAAAVVTWERYLAYGVATGVAHRAAEELPFDIEDPDTAWSRFGGQWREIRVEYPRRLGATQSPVSVLLSGLWQVAVFGALAFLVLPIVAEVAWDVAQEVRDDPDLGGENAAFGYLVVGLVGFFGIAGLVLLVRLGIGVALLVRGLLDLAPPESIAGEIVKTHAGRVAVDDGSSPEIVAWVPPRGAPILRRGMLIRVAKTRRLHHVSRVDVLETSPGGSEPGIAATGGEDAPGRA